MIIDEAWKLEIRRIDNGYIVQFAKEYDAPSEGGPTHHMIEISCLNLREVFYEICNHFGEHNLFADFWGTEDGEKFSSELNDKIDAED